MNDHSPSTDSCSAAAGSALARSTVPAHSRSRMSHASRNPSGSVGRIFARSGSRRSSSAWTSGATSTPLTVRPSISPSIRTLRNPTPRITTSLNQASRNRAPVRSTSSKSASLRWTWWNLARCRWTCSKRESARSCWWKSAMSPTLATAADKHRHTGHRGEPATAVRGVLRRLVRRHGGHTGQGRDRAAPPRPAAALRPPACSAGTASPRWSTRCGCRPATRCWTSPAAAAATAWRSPAAPAPAWWASTSRPRRCGRRRRRPSGSGGRLTSAPATWAATGVDRTRSRACCVSTPSSSPSSPLPPTRSCAGSWFLAGGPCSPAGSRWTRLTTGLPDRLRKVDLRGGLTGAGFADVDVRERPVWRAAERAMWEEAAALDPVDDPALRSFHDEGVRSLQIFDRVRRVLATATAPACAPITWTLRHQTRRRPGVSASKGSCSLPTVALTAREHRRTFSHGGPDR